MPWKNVECHPSIKKHLKRSITRGMFGGTNLIYGPAGAGQYAVARALAMTNFCKESLDDFCGDCRECRCVLNKTFPDLIEIHPKKTVYLIEQMRELQNYALAHPYQADKKIFVLHDAHRMQKEAANSLLKILEEPYPHNIFLLLTDNISGIIPTIVSRCHKIRLVQLPVVDLCQRLTANLPEAKAETIARAAGGLPEMADSLLDSDYIGTRDSMIEWIKHVRDHESRIAEVSEKIVSKPKDLTEKTAPVEPGLYFLDSPDLKNKEKDRLLEKFYLRKRLTVLLRLIRDGMLVVSGVNNSPFLNADRMEDIHALWENETPEGMFEKFEKTLEAMEGIDRNLNTSILLTDLLLTMRPAAH